MEEIRGLKFRITLVAAFKNELNNNETNDVTNYANSNVN